MTKTCTKCKEEKPLEDFPKKKTYKDGHSNMCRVPCTRDYNREYQRKNAEKVNAKNYKWREENKEAHYESLRKWRHKNPDKIAGYNKKWIADEDNRSRKLEHNQDRRALEKSRSRDKLPRGWRKAVFEFYGNVRCMNPECVNPDGQPTIDHVVPLERGGWHEIMNFQVLCGPCNSTKNAYHSTDYRPFPRLLDRKVS